VFGRYLWKGVIFTKDNLAKRNWHGSKKYVFYYLDVTIKHLFFQCCFARSIWLVMQVALTLYPLRIIVNISKSWLSDVDHMFKKHIRVGAITII
jgi:hypothetical protein